MSFREFQADLSREMQDMKKEIDEARTTLALEADAGVREKTPVDTGFAQNSWFAEVGDGATQDDNGGSGGPRAAEAVAQSGAFDAITIANGAEYIGVLENGHSKQAPNGMVDVTIAELETRFRIMR